MISFPLCELDRDALCSYQLDWLVRAHPAGILPLCSLRTDTGIRLYWLTAGLLPADEATQWAATHLADPIGWLQQTLLEILHTLTAAQDIWITRQQFILQASALWFSPTYTAAEHLRPGTPRVAFLPATDLVHPGCLTTLADALLSQLAQAQPDLQQTPAFQACNDALVAGDAALSQWVAQLATTASASQTLASSAAVSHQDACAVATPHDGAPTPSLRILAWLAWPMFFALLPILCRWLRPDLLRTTRWQLLAAAGLGLTALSVAWVLFWPSSPLCCVQPTADHSFHPGSWWQTFRRDVRMSGLLAACAARMGQAGRMGAYTQPLAILDENTRLGFLSEQEPGSPEEAQGLRAYILTAQFVIGRDPDLADLVLPDAEVGRAHTRIEQHNGSFFMTDLGSYNGTWLDGQRLPKNEQVPLPDHCVIGVAKRHFHFTVD